MIIFQELNGIISSSAEKILKNVIEIPELALSMETGSKKRLYVQIHI